MFGKRLIPSRKILIYFLIGDKIRKIKNATYRSFYSDVFLLITEKAPYKPVITHFLIINERFFYARR